jgi:hypothetical protein
MSEKKQPSKVENRGGAREGSGRPKELKGGKVYKFYLDDATIAALDRINKNRSKAIRILAGTDNPLE